MKKIFIILLLLCASYCFAETFGYIGTGTSSSAVLDAVAAKNFSDHHVVSVGDTIKYLCIRAYQTTDCEIDLAIYKVSAGVVADSVATATLDIVAIGSLAWDSVAVNIVPTPNDTICVAFGNESPDGVIVGYTSMGDEEGFWRVFNNSGTLSSPWVEDGASYARYHMYANYVTASGESETFGFRRRRIMQGK